MKAIILLTLTLLVIFATITFGQNKTYYHKNNFNITWTECENPPTFGADSLSLQKYFEEKLQNQISKTKGQIKIAVIIDTTGKPLCEWIDNNSNLKLKKENLDFIIDSMPNWKSGFQNGRNVVCVGIITLTFNKKELEAKYKIGKDY
jgi:hypothetical protein